MIDGHCHISADEFDQDRDVVLKLAKDSGVKAIVGVCEFPSCFDKLLRICEDNPELVFPCIGVHPVQQSSTDSSSCYGDRSVNMQDFEAAEACIHQNLDALVGIGEIGLDFTPRYIKCPEDKEVQRSVFRKQIQLAKQFDLPVNVHSRSAGRPVLDILIEEGAKDVLLHAFDGKVSVAQRGVQAGYFFSVPPCILRSEQKQKLVKAIPLSNLLLETDAPALGPEKQERNVPSNLSISAAEVARIKQISIAEVREATSANALKLFRKIEPLLNKCKK